MDIEICQFTESDLAFGKELTDSEEWNRGVSDWKRILQLEPEGFFKAKVDGQNAGIIGTMRYDRVAWINSLIVGKEFRGRHVADALMRQCLEYSERSGATSIKLDSIPGVEPFYERFGFRTDFPSLRFLGNVKETKPSFGVFQPRLEEVLRLDLMEVGIDRGKVLRALYSDPSARSFAKGDDGEITGFLLTRQGQGRVDLGPCVVRDGDIGVAEDLLRTATATIPATTFKLCVPGSNRKAAELIAGMGIEQFAGPTRMSKGVPYVEPPSIITMMSPEKG